MTSKRHNRGPALEPYRPRLHNGPDGWVSIERKSRDHWLVGFGQPVAPMDGTLGALSRAEAWQDLIMECRYSAGTINNGGRRMEVLPGQLVGAVSWLAKRWNWTPKTVRWWLDKLEAEGMISFSEKFKDRGNQNGKQAQIITICNYSEYQLVQEQQRQTKGQTDGKQGANEGQTNGNIYKDNKGTKEQGNNTPASQEAGEDIIIPRSLESGADLSGEVLDAAWKIAGEISEKVKGPSKNSSPRNRPKGELDGSHGITFAGGKLKVVNGTLSLLRSEFPGIDFDAVCNKAAPALAKLSYPTFEHAMATLRQYAQYAMDDAAKRTGGKGKLRGRVVDQVLKSLSPEKQREYFARMKGGGNA